MAEDPLDWEDEPTNVLEVMLEEIEYDVFSNSIVISADWNGEGERERLEFNDISELEDALQAVAEEVIVEREYLGIGKIMMFLMQNNLPNWL